jgi:hypothetical protein
MEREVTKALQGNPRGAAGMLDGQAPIAAVGLVAIVVIVAINYFARPSLPSNDGAAPAPRGCSQCGTIVAIRRSAHSVPVTFVEIQMADGSVRTVRSPGPQFSVGDAVEVKEDAVTLRPRS